MDSHRDSRDGTSREVVDPRDFERINLTDSGAFDTLIEYGADILEEVFIVLLREIRFYGWEYAFEGHGVVLTLKVQADGGLTVSGAYE